MGFSRTEIETKRAAVPPQFRPPADQEQLLGNIFYDVADTEVSATPASRGTDIMTNDRLRELAGQIFVGNPDATASFILSGAQIALQARDEQKRREKRHRDQLIYDEIRADIERRLAELDARLADIDQRLGEITQRRDTIAGRLDAIDDINMLLASGQLDPDNPAHAALLNRAGYSADDARDDGFADRVKKDRRDLSREDDILALEADSLLKERDEVEREKKDVKRVQAALESADTEEARLTATRHAQTVLGRQELAAAAHESGSVDAKQLAANAIVETDVASYRAVSADATQAVTKDQAKFFSGGDDMDWDNPPPAKPAI